jgi:hypothetical protein
VATAGRVPQQLIRAAVVAVVALVRQALAELVSPHHHRLAATVAPAVLVRQQVV